MPKAIRTSPCGRAEARSRLKSADAYLATAELVLDKPEREEFHGVAAGNAVLAAIAATDAICCTRLQARHRGEGHPGAAEMLERATPDGAQLAATLRRLLDLKDAAHYGADTMASGRARDAVRWSRRLVERAREEVER